MGDTEKSPPKRNPPTRTKRSTLADEQAASVARAKAAVRRSTPKVAVPASTAPKIARRPAAQTSRESGRILDRLIQYAKLARMHKPVGALLLLWPTWWALW